MVCTSLKGLLACESDHPTDGHVVTTAKSGSYIKLL